MKGDLTTDSKKLAKEKTREIKEKISSHQGDIILIYREFTMAYGGYHSGVKKVIGPRPTYAYFIETGIIDGKLIANSAPEEQKINLSSDIYTYKKDLLVPALRVISEYQYLSPPFELTKDVLTRASDRAISFSLDELIGRRFSLPALSNFDISIGEEELMKLTERTGMRSDYYLRELSHFLKNPDRLDKIKDDRISALSEDLLRRGTQITLYLDRLAPLIGDLERVEMSPYGGDKGDTPDWGWSLESRETIKNYESLKGEIERERERIKETIKELNSLGTTSREISTERIIGIHGVISLNEYITTFKTITEPTLRKKIEEADSIIAKKRKR
ncbi:hypothetical protein HY450_03320 [Candidatus Pacearchaeota archaeon]|nr:hypothetical protein [Candidatus Pacearchaeota archaeon]